jgi:hypothetical protein
MHHIVEQFHPAGLIVVVVPAPQEPQVVGELDIPQLFVFVVEVEVLQEVGNGGVEVPFPAVLQHALQDGVLGREDDLACEEDE